MEYNEILTFLDELISTMSSESEITHDMFNAVVTFRNNLIADIE